MDKLGDELAQEIRRVDGNHSLGAAALAEALLPFLRAQLAGGGTPAAKWRANGEPDPHGKQYECERAALAYGHYTDDELANAVFLCDHRNSFDSIGYLTAAKDRIRWLSRALETSIAAAPTPAAVGQGEHIAVLERLEKALPDVGINGWMAGVKAVRYAIDNLAPAAVREVDDAMVDRLYQAAFFAKPFVEYAAKTAENPRLAIECVAAIEAAMDAYMKRAAALARDGVEGGA